MVRLQLCGSVFMRTCAQRTSHCTTLSFGQQRLALALAHLTLTPPHNNSIRWNRMPQNCSPQDDLINLVASCHGTGLTQLERKVCQSLHEGTKASYFLCPLRDFDMTYITLPQPTPSNQLNELFPFQNLSV